MDHLTDLRADIDALPTSGRARRYPPVLRARVCEAARSARAEGHTWASICASLALPENTVKRWVRSSASEALPMRPVRIVSDVPSALTLETASGHRVMGLNVTTAAALLKQLEA